jgi:serine/threonine-protein kinase Chk1
MNSPEFEAYVSGELLRYEPWTKISREPLRKFRRVSPPARNQISDVFFRAEVLLGLLDVNPKERWSLQQVACHPWLLT